MWSHAFRTRRPPLESAWSSDLHIWRDENKFRVDQLDAKYTPPRPKHNAGDRHVTCENCEKDGYGIITTIASGFSPSLRAVEFHRLGARNFDYYCTHFDWRYLGLGNDRQCAYPRTAVAADFRQFFRPAWRSSLAPTIGGAIACLLVSSKRANSNRAVWLSERDGYHPVCYEDTFTIDGELERRTTEISWQQTAGGHLYPKTVRHNAIITVGGSNTLSKK